MITHGPVLECIGLKKSFGNIAVLHDIHFKVDEGTILGLVGPNGAGKTTLLKILATLIAPSAGQALVCGNDVVRDPLRVKKKIGFVPSEERSFYWRLSARQNLRFFAALHHMKGRDTDRRINRLLSAVGLEDKGHVRFREFSTGMKQALGLARGLLHDPLVLLMDEPMRSLSPDIASRVRQLIHEKAKKEGKAVLIASHNLNELEKLADRIVVIHHGALEAVGTVSELKAQTALPPSADLDEIFRRLTSGKDPRA